MKEETITESTEDTDKKEKEKEKDKEKKKQSFWTQWKKKFRPSTDWWLHFGNGLAIISMACQEMLPLRCFLVGANCCALVFYQMQKPPLKVPSIWSVVFAAGHTMMIIRLLLENRQVEMSDLEHEIYCNAFREHGFSPFQFKRIMKEAKYMRVAKGDIICSMLCF